MVWGWDSIPASQILDGISFILHGTWIEAHVLNPIQDGPFWGLFGGKKSLLPKTYHTYPTMKKLGAVILCLKKIQKKHISHVTHLVSSVDISIFSQEISNFFNNKKYWYRLHVNLTFFESIKFVLINMVAILMMPVKVGTLG